MLKNGEDDWDLILAKLLVADHKLLHAVEKGLYQVGMGLFQKILLDGDVLQYSGAAPQNTILV